MALKTSHLVALIGFAALAVFGVIAGLTLLSDRRTSTTPTVLQVLPSELERQQQAAAVANVRALVPALEAYDRDHGSYAGATLQNLRDHYDPGLVGANVVRVSADSYCIESVVGTGSAFKASWAASIMPGTCLGSAASSAPPEARSVGPSPDYRLRAFTNVWSLIPALEGYRADHGTYAGATLQILNDHYDSGVAGATVVAAGAHTFCVESTVGPASVFKAGPTARILPGTCPRG